MDIYVTAPGVDLAAETPTVTINIGYASDYLGCPRATTRCGSPRGTPRPS